MLIRVPSTIFHRM
jgi:hypothetical protein